MVVDAKRESVDPAKDDLNGEAGEATLVNTHNECSNQSISLDAPKESSNAITDISPCLYSLKTQSQNDSVWSSISKENSVFKNRLLIVPPEEEEGVILVPNDVLENSQCLEATEEDAAIENSPCLVPPDEHSSNANILPDMSVQIGVLDHDSCLEPPKVNALLVRDADEANTVPVQRPVLENEEEDPLRAVNDDILDKNSFLKPQTSPCLEATEEDAAIENSPCLDPPGKDEHSSNANILPDMSVQIGVLDHDSCLEPPKVNALLVRDADEANTVPVQQPVLENEEEDPLRAADDDISDENSFLKPQTNNNPTNISSLHSAAENSVSDDSVDVDDDNHSAIYSNVSDDNLLLPDNFISDENSVDGLTFADLLNTSQACTKKPNDSLAITDLLATSQACAKEPLLNYLSKTRAETEKQISEPPLSNLNVDKQNVVSSETDPSIASPTMQSVRRISHNLSKTLLNWNCKTCGHNAKTKKELISHIYDVHLREDYEMKIKCKSCNFECGTQSEMAEHNLSHETVDKRIAQKSAPVLRVVLQDCLLIPTKSIVRRNNKDNETLVISDKKDDLPIRKNNNRVKCFLCNYETDTEQRLRDHVKRHSGMRYYCDKHFWQNASANCPKCVFEKIMSRLRQRKPPLSFKCFDCNKAISEKEELKIHALSKHPESSFKCDRHKSKTNFYECAKCVYELIFKTWVKIAGDNGGGRFDMGAAIQDSSDRSFSKQPQRRNRYKEPRANVKYVASSSGDSDDVGIGKRAQNKTVSSYDSEISNEIQTKCFDCKYDHWDNITNFKGHAIRHLGSKYQCLDHWNSKLDSCLKCRYEITIQNLYSEVIYCRLCKYKARRQFLMDRHLASKQACSNLRLFPSLSPNELMCFDCRYITIHKELLKHHMVDHLDREFVCKKHPRIKQKDCLECVHEESLEDAKKELRRCRKCGFKTVNKDIFKLHVCIVEVAKKYTCFDCNKFAADALDELRAHAVIHDSSSYQCSDHCSETAVGDCPKCIYQNVVRNFKDQRDNDETSSQDEIECNEGKITAKCFDCGFYASSGKNVDFTSHICRHIGSKYQCLEHLDDKNEACLKCHYETSLRTFRRQIYLCDNCGYRTIEKFRMTTHLAGRKSCTVGKGQWIDESEIMCFECSYITRRKSLLKYHMVDHLDRDFKCDRHVEIKNEKCSDCINERCLDEARNEAVTCYICNFKTVVGEVFATHNCKSYRAINNFDAETITTESDGSSIPKCFDCNYSNEDKPPSEFKLHVFRHLGSKFQCSEHWKVKKNDCLKCLYEKELTSFRNSTTKLYNLTRRQGVKDGCSITGSLRCFRCPYVTLHKNLLKYHLVDHLDHEFACQLHPAIKDDACLECTYKECLESAKKEVLTCNKCEFKTVMKLAFERHECALNKTSAEEHDSTNQTSEINAKCFDCKYSTADGAFSFRKHLIRHFGSKYQCMEHSKVKDKDCSKCYYELELKNLPNYVKCCTYCAYKSFGSLDLKNHLKELACRNWQCTKDLKPGELVCFKCYYITTHKKFLKYHVVDHLDHTFSCSEHPEKKNKSCVECIYEQCIENAKKEVLRCKTCKFKTAAKQIFESHNCSSREIDSNKRKASTEAEQLVAIKKSRGDKEIGVKCFDCKFSTTDKGDIFRKHIVRHLGSKYRCMEHLKANSKECLKCLYELELQNIHDCAKYCKMCAFKTVDSQELHAHIKENACKDWQDNYKLSPGEIICLKCRYVTTHKKFLKYHLVDHLDHEFSCREHRDTKDVKCSGCIYELCLESAKKDVSICRKCEFKTAILPIFKTHGCFIDENIGEVTNATGLALSCFDCNDFIADTVEELRKHVVLHPQSKVECDKHGSGIALKDCSKCIYQSLIRTYQSNDNSGNDAAKAQNISGTSQEDISIVDSNQKCFDCKYTCADSMAFRTHVCRHLGSKFQCMEHWKNKNGDCLKCRYEDLLQNLQKEVKCCKICHYRAMDALSLTRHVEDESSCTRWADRRLEPGEIRCLECQYVTTRNKFLKYHMVDHLDRKLSCDIHGESKNETCDKCINKECLESAKKEARVCEKCSFKTVIEQIFEIHACKDNTENLLEGGQDETTEGNIENNINNAVVIPDVLNGLAELRSGDIAEGPKLKVTAKDSKTQCLPKDDQAEKNGDNMTIQENIVSETESASENNGNDEIGAEETEQSIEIIEPTLSGSRYTDICKNNDNDEANKQKFQIETENNDS